MFVFVNFEKTHGEKIDIILCINTKSIFDSSHFGSDPLEYILENLYIDQFYSNNYGNLRKK